MNEDKIITIPEEVIKGSMVNPAKKIYLYLNPTNDFFYLNNIKFKGRRCYGCFLLDENYSFHLPHNISEKINLTSNYCVCNQDGDINVEPTSFHLSCKNSVKLLIPKHILDLQTVNFKKTVYLCKNGDIYLTNHYAKTSNIRCYGIVSIDTENCIELTANMCTELSISSANEILLYAEENVLVLQKSS